MAEQFATTLDEVLTLRAENVLLRAALKHAAGVLSELEYHWHGEDFWPPIRAALLTTAERGQP